MAFVIIQITSLSLNNTHIPISKDRDNNESQNILLSTHTHTLMEEDYSKYNYEVDLAKL